MAIDYDALKLKVDRIIQENGFAATFTRVEQGNYNPLTGAYDTTTTTYDVHLVKDTFSVFERANGNIQQGDIKAIGTAADYRVGDTVEIGGHGYRLIPSDPIEPADTQVAATLMLRR